MTREVELLKTLEKDESIVSMMEFQGKLYVATCWRVMRLNGNEFEQLLFVPHNSLQ